MEREFLIQAIQKLEKKYKVSTWEINGVHIWPLIRIDLFFFNYKGKTTAKATRKPGIKSYLKRFTLSFSYSIKFLFKKIRNDNVAFAGADTHRIKIEGKNYNRYFDSLLDHLEQRKESGYILEYQGALEERSLYYKEDRVIEVFRIIYIMGLINKVFPSSRRQRTVILEDYHKFLEEASNLGINTNQVSLDKLIVRVDQILLYEKLFSYILKRMRPSYCIILCYYSKEAFGLLQAANKLGIRTVDMQHGTQGPLHVAYSNWDIPQGFNYKLLPGAFWCWDKSSCLNLESWARSSENHQVLLGGNPWITKVLKNTKKGRCELPDNIILYTLQPVGEVLEDYIIKAIRSTSEKFRWYLRLHPRQLDQKEELYDKLRRTDLLNVVNVEDATSLPLTTLLLSSVVHLSKFSGAVLEASSLCIPSIIIDQTGVDSFEELIKNGSAYKCLQKDSQKLVEVIEMISKQERVKHVSVVDSYKNLDKLLHQNV